MGSSRLFVSNPRNIGLSFLEEGRLPAQIKALLTNSRKAPVDAQYILAKDFFDSPTLTFSIGLGILATQDADIAIPQGGNDFAKAFEISSRGS